MPGANIHTNKHTNKHTKKIQKNIQTNIQTNIQIGYVKTYAVRYEQTYKTRSIDHPRVDLRRHGSPEDRLFCMTIGLQGNEYRSIKIHTNKRMNKDTNESLTEACKSM